MSEQKYTQEPRLDAPAMVGHGRFMTGVAWRTVIKEAQIRYEQEVTQESEELRLGKVAETNLIVAIRDLEIDRLTQQRDGLLRAAKFAEQVLKDLHAEGFEYDFSCITSAIANAEGGL